MIENTGTKPPTQLSVTISLGLLLLYIAFNYVTVLTINPPEGIATALFIGTFKSLPLIAFFPFLIGTQNYKLYAWLCFLLILYFCWAVLNAFAPGIAGLAGMVECGIIILLFTSSMFSARWVRRSPVESVESIES